MKRLTLKMVNGVKVGDVLSVGVAHQFENGWWSKYTFDDYIVLDTSRKKITCQNKRHSIEMLTITRKNLDDGYMTFFKKLNSEQNAERSVATEDQSGNKKPET